MRSNRSLWSSFATGLALILIAWLVTAGLRAWYPTGTDFEEKRAVERHKNLKALREADQQALHPKSIEWMDQAKGLVRIPIEQAMQIEIPILNQKAPAAAYPIATPPAAATPAVAPTTKA